MQGLGLVLLWYERTGEGLGERENWVRRGVLDGGQSSGEQRYVLWCYGRAWRLGRGSVDLHAGLGNEEEER